MMNKLSRFIGNIKGNDIEENISPEIQDSEEDFYLQWYEKDAERLKLEIQKVLEDFPGINCMRMNDARIGFKGEVCGYNICLMCDYQYPLNPPEIYLYGLENKSFMDQDGVFNLFQATDFVWHANFTYIADVIRKISDFLKIYIRVKEEIVTVEEPIAPESGK